MNDEALLPAPIARALRDYSQALASHECIRARGFEGPREVEACQHEIRTRELLVHEIVSALEAARGGRVGAMSTQIDIAAVGRSVIVRFESVDGGAPRRTIVDLDATSARTMAELLVREAEKAEQAARAAAKGGGGR